MPLSTYVQNEFAFLHSNQIDAIYTVYSSTQIKTYFDSQAEELRTNHNGIIAVLQQETVGDSGADNIHITPNASFPTKNTLQKIIDQLISLGAGSVPPDGTITDAKLATDNKVGSLVSLTTTAKTSVAAAINELVTSISTKVGDLTTLLTTAKTSCVAAINELVANNAALTGSIIYYAYSTPPSGYLKANGAAVSRTTYAALFSAIGTTYGAGDGSTTFNLPDCRGVVPRGWDDGRGYDIGRTFGSYQADDIKQHNHPVTLTGGNHSHPLPYALSANDFGGVNGATPTNRSTSNTGNSGNLTLTGTTDNTGSTENTVKNIALLACIKY